MHLNVRHVDGSFELRAEQEWPLARTEWTEFHVDAQHATLSPHVSLESGSAQFDALGEGLTFTTGPFAADTEITGPAAARLFVASSSRSPSKAATSSSRATGRGRIRTASR